MIGLFVILINLWNQIDQSGKRCQKPVDIVREIQNEDLILQRKTPESGDELEEGSASLMSDYNPRRKM